MPELPEVETIKESMRLATVGARIASVVVYNRQMRQNIPDDFEAMVTGAQITRLYRIAKYAIMELDNGYSVIRHIGMSGKMKLTKEENPLKEKHDHVMIKTTMGIIIYNDPRRFGMVTYCKSDDVLENPLLCRLGLDPFDANLTPIYLKSKLAKKRIPIKIALLDQEIISGIGNIYASEALYVARISPLREANKIKINELRCLIEAVREVLTKAIAAGGSTLHDYRRPDGDIGYFQLQHTVYGKDGKKCPCCVAPDKRCKGILKLVQGGRSTYYCPHLQK